MMRSPCIREYVEAANLAHHMSITPYLGGFDIDPETRRVMGVALEMTRGATSSGPSTSRRTDAAARHSINPVRRTLTVDERLGAHVRFCQVQTMVRESVRWSSYLILL
jgi:hypothetical protein